MEKTFLQIGALKDTGTYEAIYFILFQLKKNVLKLKN